MPTDGERLDLHLVRLGYASSRRAARQLIERGMVRINGRAGRKGAMVSSSDGLEVAGSDERPGIEPNPEVPVEVLFEDAAVVVINKPAPMPCHPLRPMECETVMNGVVARFPETATAGDNPREGGLVHRLDNGTSGALIVAREARAFATLRDAVRTGLIIRRYEALVAGSIKSKKTLDAPIAHHPRNRRKMVAVRQDEGRRVHGPRPAITIVEPVEPIGEFTLVSVAPRTGSRHQIRVHLAGAGHPLAGDKLYGGALLSEFEPGRLWLHLRDVEFDSPVSGRVRVEAPLPSDLASALGRVRAHR